ncbi:MAG TPA: hypothetical protein PK866_14080 [Nitrospira sp.]|nr:hypothetical protein [Nitrospira sp.]
MNNHFHLLVETPQANRSTAMRQLNGGYTQAFSCRHDRVGQFLPGHFKAIVVEATPGCCGAEISGLCCRGNRTGCSL